jgi:hypothetical protein|tara:strand:+ start:291 stop:542 length:252 start_codon:yes stop_codon:yes gene_type:complete
MPDNVNSPPHYNQSNIECIDVIRESLGSAGFQAYCHGNAQKYLWRHSYKGNPVEDLDKAIWYMTRLRNEILVEHGKDEKNHAI